MTQTDSPLATASFAYQKKRGAGAQKLLARFLPRTLLRRMKRLLLVPMDGADWLLGRSRELVPPRYLNYAGDGDFEASGDEFLKYFIELGGLTPANRVLEVGSGIGRMARPLTKFLVGGSYEGIDIVPEGIRWCQKNISNRYSNFHFHLADVHNLMYNPRGHFAAANYQFPFGNDEFDFCCLTSVFTHMLRPDMEHYLAEIARTMRPGGRCLATYFLLNDESRSLMNAGRSSLVLQFPVDGCWTDDAEVPEHAVAFDEAHIRSVYGEHGFNLETISYGAWCGRSEYLSYQDIVVVRKL